MPKLTKKELDRASKIAMEGLKLPSGARLVALKNLNTGFTPLKSKDETQKFINKKKKKRGEGK